MWAISASVRVLPGWTWPRSNRTVVEVRRCHGHVPETRHLQNMQERPVSMLVLPAAFE